MNIERLKRINPSFHFYTTEDERFQRYGERLEYPTYHLFRHVIYNIPVIGSSFHYEADYPELHHFALASQIQKDIFQGKDIQFGLISGFDSHIDGLTCRFSRECLIAFTDCIFILDCIRDIQPESFDLKTAYCLLLQKGECIVLFPDTMRSKPLPASLNGYVAGILHQKDIRICG